MAPPASHYSLSQLSDSDSMRRIPAADARNQASRVPATAPKNKKKRGGRGGYPRYFSNFEQLPLDPAPVGKLREHPLTSDGSTWVTGKPGPVRCIVDSKNKMVGVAYHHDPTNPGAFRAAKYRPQGYQAPETNNTSGYVSQPGSVSSTSGLGSRYPTTSGLFPVSEDTAMQHVPHRDTDNWDVVSSLSTGATHSLLGSASASSQSSLDFCSPTPSMRPNFDDSLSPNALSQVDHHSQSGYDSYSSQNSGSYNFSTDYAQSYGQQSRFGF